jgi:F-type H+-transporting ATPase subunit b
MAETIYLLAQAETPSSPADTGDHGTVVVDEHADAPAGDTHATTEADGGHHATVFPPFDASTFPSQILWFALTFGALYLLMSRVALPQIGSIIDKRKARIEGDLKEAERLRGETDKAVAAYEQALADARANAHAIAEETRASIKADLDGKRKAVEEDLSKKVAEAEARISANKEQAMSRVSEIASETATALVSQLTGEANASEVNAAVADVVKG